MSKVFFIVLVSFPINSGIANSITSLNNLTKEEIDEVESRLEDFYGTNRPEAMSAIAPKYSVRDEVKRSPHPELKDKKTDPKFRSVYCKKVLKKHFPGIACDEEDNSWSTVLPNDRVENLTDSWMRVPTKALDEIPVEGKSDLPLWSDDYWRTKWGYTSYRYADYESSHEQKTYKQMIALYKQPADFMSVLTLAEKEIEKRLIRYSPAEKYDLTVGDNDFSLTQEQKEEGKQNVGANGDVEDWMGLCHGWAPASLMVKRPLKPVTVNGTRDLKVTWYPADLKAMLTLQWSNGNYANNFIGGRCGEKAPKLFPNGRIKNQECFDNNPATFHLSLGNMIGIEKASFVMDKTWDYEVWNQPVVSYEFTYFNPLNRNKRSRDWKEVAVDYDDAFKSADRFQKPLTRGKGIEKVVGVIATVVYVSEVSPPAHSPEVEKDELLRMTLTYDLELSELNGKWVASGGEWHENAHPDFLWVPKKEAFAEMRFDKTALNYSGTPTSAVTATAKKASAEAYPLCQVMKTLVEKSTGEKSVRCAATN